MSLQTEKGVKLNRSMRYLLLSVLNMLHNMYRSTGRKHYILQISNSLFMIPRPPKGLHSLFKDREKITQTLFFFSCNNIFWKTKTFCSPTRSGVFLQVFILFIGWNTDFSYPRLKVVLSTTHTPPGVCEPQAFISRQRVADLSIQKTQFILKE